VLPDSDRNFCVQAVQSENSDARRTCLCAVRVRKSLNALILWFNRFDVAILRYLPRNLRSMCVNMYVAQLIPRRSDSISNVELLMYSQMQTIKGDLMPEL
jgi:hypothetical protein